MKSIGILKVIASIGSSRIKIIKALDLIVGTVFARLIKNKPASKNIPNTLNKILIIRPGGIGDAVLLLPILRTIKKSHECIEIDILCEKRNVEVFKSQTGLCSTILCYDKFNDFRQLIKREYDVIIDTEQWHYLSAIVNYFMSSKTSIGFNSRTYRNKFFIDSIPYRQNVYELENFKDLFSRFFQKVNQINNLYSSFTIDDNTLSWAEKTVPRKSITLSCAASIKPKCLPDVQIKNIIANCIEHDYIVILIGGADMKLKGENFKNLFSSASIYNYCGTTSLMQTAALIKQSKLFIGLDSAPLHLAYCVGTPTIAIFGPSDACKWGSHSKNDKIFTRNLACSPCSSFGYTIPTCKGTYSCTHDINLTDLLETIHLSLKN